MIVTFHNSFSEMIIKIVKVFVRQSLDYFFDVWYNMIDVEIGLAAERFGQFGERRQMRHIRYFTRTLYNTKFCPRQFGRRRQYQANLYARGSLSVVAP